MASCRRASRSANSASMTWPRTAELRARADRLSAWIGDPAVAQGPGLDAAVVGYLAALCYEHAAALPELRAELEDLGYPVGLLGGLGVRDVDQILFKIL